MVMMSIYRFVYSHVPHQPFSHNKSLERMLSPSYGRHCYAKNKIHGKLNSAAAVAVAAAADGGVDVRIMSYMPMASIVL